MTPIARSAQGAITLLARAASAPVPAIALALTLTLLPAAVRAQWSSSAGVNNAICSAPESQLYVTATTDGAGGAVIAWEDFRDESLGDIYAQRMSADGVPMWAPGGVPIVTVGAPENPRLVPDGQGGAILVYEEGLGQPEPKLMGQRISSNGSLLWPASGAALCSASTIFTPPTVIADGDGGAVIAWTDSRAAGWNGTDIDGQHVDRNGRILWPPDGLPVCEAAGNQNEPALAMTADGDIVITWQDDRAHPPGSAFDLYAQRVTRAGSILWSPNGIAIHENAGTDTGPVVVSDAAGGVFVIWIEPRADGITQDIRAQRVDGAGARLWGADGVAVTDIASPKAAALAVGDGAGGFIAAWEDERSYARLYDIETQRMDSTGTATWDSNGVALSAASGNQLLRCALPDGAGGAVFAWEDRRAVLESDIYAGRITASGTPAWVADGLPVSTAPGDQDQPVMVAAAPLAGAASSPSAELLFWIDARATDNDVYGARIRPDGTLGASYLADHFTIERADGAPLDTLVAGTPAALRLVARTVSGFVATEFAGTVMLSTDGQLQLGAGITPSFTSGVFAPDSIIFAHSGRHHLFAAQTGGPAGGASPLLIVRPPRPGGFAVAPSPLAERTVHLSWSPGATGDAAGYNVFRSISAIYDTTSFRVLQLPSVATSVTDTVPDFGTWHYVVVALDSSGIPSAATPDLSATTSPLVFDVATSIFQNQGATRHLDLVVSAESLLAAPPVVTLAESSTVVSEITAGAIAGSATSFAGAFDLPAEGVYLLRTRAAVPDGRVADRLRSFNAVELRGGDETRLATPDGAVAIDLAGDALPAGSWLLAERTDSDDVRVSPDVPLRDGALLEWTIGAGKSTGAESLRIERRDGDHWTPLLTHIDAGGRALSASTDQLGTFRLAPGASDSAGTASAGSFELALQPNPSRGAVSIAWSLARSGVVDLAVFDVSGRRVRTLVAGRAKGAGFTQRWDARDATGSPVPAGLYFVRLATTDGTVTRKLLVLR